MAPVEPGKCCGDCGGILDRHRVVDPWKHEKVLSHYGCTFDDVIVENVFTTNMAAFLEVSAYRAGLYQTHFPAGSWLEVKGLALPEFMLEIELEARTPSA